jgi:NAD(P)H-dependent flavin oxidoreductase YrpB (nitropropane dioxygenase family)
MNVLVPAGLPRHPGVGDIISDLQGLYALASAQSDDGGIGGYIGRVYREFSDMPADVRRIQSQIDRVKVVLANANADTSLVGSAQRDLATLTSMLPAVQSRVRALMEHLAPILPQLQAGTLTQDAIATLASYGVDVVGVFRGVQDVFKLRDNAGEKVAQATRQPGLSPDVAQAAANALANAGLPHGLMMVGLVGVMAWIASSFFRNRP